MLRAGLEIALTIALASQGARLLWIIVEPMAPFVPPEPPSRVSEAKLASLTRVNPFLPRQSRPAAQQLPGSSDSGLTLFGVRSGGKDGGSAIIGTAGTPQALFAVGDEVVPGTVLKSISPDHVALAQGSRIILLALANVTAGTVASAVPSYLTSSPRPATQTARSQPVVIDPKKFLAESGLRPHTQNGQVVGYTLLPRGQAETLRRAGLEAGDVLVGLNGSPISPELYSQLEHELVAGPQVQLTVQRGSETKTITLETGR